MKLTDVSCRNAKALDKAYKKADGHGLYLLVNTNGSKLWRWKYRFMGKEKLLALGEYAERRAQYANSTLLGGACHSTEVVTPQIFRSKGIILSFVFKLNHYHQTYSI